MLKKIEKILKALSDKNRLAIVNMLVVKPLCVCEIKAALPISQSTVSGHLKILKDAEIITDIKDGLWVDYSLNRENPDISEVLKVVTELMERDQELADARSQAAGLDRNSICKK